MEHSPLARLPAEIRNDIFELVVVMDEVIEYPDYELEGRLPRNDWNHSNGSDSETEEDGENRYDFPMADAFALMSTCKQIRAECLSTFYATTAFRFDIEPTSSMNAAERRAKAERGISLLGRWVKSLGQGAQHLRTITIKLEMWVPQDSAHHRPHYLARIIHRFYSAFGGTRAKVDFEFELVWSWDVIGNPSGDVKISLPLVADDQQAVMEKLSDVRKILLTDHDGRVEEWLKELSVGEEHLRKLFEALRRLQNPRRVAGARSGKARVAIEETVA
ncbi:hypothetical protein LTR85_008784 [Meristemomyces frigidus]|nr:hypothetical protein LTR85_008784 [Meristemomyces frigidus]